MSNPFSKHPNEVGLNYFQHMIFAFGITAKLLGCVFACFIHAFFPFLFTDTTSNTVKELHSKIEHRKHH